jgi:MFS family permease
MSFTSAPEFVPRWADVYVSAAARAVSNCGDIVAATALALVLVERGQGGLAVAALLMAAAIPPVLLGPFVGRMADRFDSRTLIVVTGFAQAAVCVALAYASGTVLTVALVALLAAGLAVTQPTMSALTPAMVGKENLAKAGGISQTASTMGLLAGPAIAGLLVHLYGARPPLLIDAVSYLAIPVAGFLIRTRRGGASRVTTTPGGRQEVFRMRADALIWPTMVLIGAVVLAISAVNVVDVFFVTRTLHSTATMYGLTGACWMAGMVIGSIVMSTRKDSDAVFATTLLGLLTATCLTVLATSFAPSIGWVIPLSLFGGVLNGCENVCAGVLLGRRVPANVRGHAGAMFNGIASGANAAGFLIGGLLLSVSSPRVMLFGTAVAGLAVTAMFAPPMVRAIRADRAAVARSEPREAELVAA